MSATPALAFLAPDEAVETAESKIAALDSLCTPAIRRWRRVFELAPDIGVALRGARIEIEAEHALLLTLLHPSDRKAVLPQGYEAILRECAYIVAQHEDGGYDDALQYLSGIDDHDNRIEALEDYIATTRNEQNNEIERDIEAILACEKCAAFWKDLPRHRRAILAASALSRKIAR